LSNGPSSLADHNHEGHNGWTIRQLRANIDTWMATSKPDAVLLNIGDNDILFDDNPSGAPGRLKDLVVRICEDRPGVRVLLSNLVGAVGYESQDAAFNSKVPGIASAVRAAGCNVTFVDLHRAVPQAYLSDDGDHPSSAGYDKMADAWYAALAPMMARS
jgi:lysophospholipase L1-like esterase